MRKRVDSCVHCHTGMFSGDIVWISVQDSKRVLHNYPPCKDAVGVTATKVLADILAQEFSMVNEEDYAGLSAAARLGGISSAISLAEVTHKDRKRR
jgi:hypothetical protein